MIEDYLFTKKTKWFIWGALGVVVVVLVYHAGFVAGQHQHMRPRVPFGGAMPTTGGMLGGIMPQEGFVEDGHGAVGEIATVTLPTFTLTTREGLTEKVYAGTSTIVTGAANTGVNSLTHGQLVIIIGDPQDQDDQGYLDARIIHILPAASPAQ